MLALLQAVVAAFLSTGVGGAVLVVEVEPIGEEVAFLSRGAGGVGVAGEAFPAPVLATATPPLPLPLPPEKNLANAAVLGETLAFGGVAVTLREPAATAGDRNSAAVLLGDGAAAVPWNLARLSTIRGEEGGTSAGHALLPETAAVASFSLACPIGDDEGGGGGGDGAGDVRGVLLLGAVSAAGAVRGDGVAAVGAAVEAGVSGAGSTCAGVAAGTEGRVTVGNGAAAVGVGGTNGDDDGDGGGAAAGSADASLPLFSASTSRANVDAEPFVAGLMLLLALALALVLVLVLVLLAAMVLLVLVAGPEEFSTRASTRERTASAFRRSRTSRIQATTSNQTRGGGSGWEPLQWWARRGRAQNTVNTQIATRITG